jgi:hypothetical protein
MADLRQAQCMALTLPNAAMAIAVDISGAGNIIQTTSGMARIG